MQPVDEGLTTPDGVHKLIIAVDWIITLSASSGKRNNCLVSVLSLLTLIELEARINVTHTGAA